MLGVHSRPPAKIAAPEGPWEPAGHQAVVTYLFFRENFIFKMHKKEAHQLKSSVILACFLSHVKEVVKVSPHPPVPGGGAG